MAAFDDPISSVEFRERCQSAGLAVTHQREVIYRAVLEMRNLDLEEDDIGPVRMKRKLPEGYEVLRASVEFHGLCPECSALNG